jgi:hypothetical protein
MNTAIENRLVESYFELMKNWDNETKKKLMIKLTRSIDSNDNKKRDFSSCFGAWEDTRTADEIIQDIRADRVNSQEIKDF